MSKAKALLINKLSKQYKDKLTKEQIEGLAADMVATQQRLGRAAEQNFRMDDPLYHWTGSSFDEFTPSATGKFGPGVYLSRHPWYGEKYVQSGTPQRMELFSNANIASQDDVLKASAVAQEALKKRKFEPYEFNKVYWEEIQKELKNNGFEGLEFSGSGRKRESEIVIFDNTKLRKKEAQFKDPKSGKLLAANAGKSNVITTAAGDVLDRFQVRDALREQGIRGLLENGVIKTYDDAGNPLGRFNTFEEAVASAKKPEGMLDLSYRGSHQAPDKDYGAPFYDLTQMVPEDVYGRSGERLYGFNDPKVDRETFSALRRVRNNPDADVTIYRAVPTNVNDINIGDWVTPSKEYAKLHGENSLGGDYKILEDTVKASKLYSEGYPYELGLVKSPLNAGLFAAMASAVNAPDTVLDPVKEAASKRFTELGLNPDTEYSYASFLPLKRAISSNTRESDVLGGYRPAIPGLLRDLMYQYLLSQEASKRGDYEQATKAAVELLL